MTLTEFKSALSGTRLSLDGRATLGALLELVDGKPRTVAAREARCSHQAIGAAISRIRRALKRCPYCGGKITRHRTRNERNLPLGPKHPHTSGCRQE